MRSGYMLLALSLALGGLLAGCSPQAACTTPICLRAHWPLNEAAGATGVADMVTNPILNTGTPKPGAVAAWPNMTGPMAVSGQVAGGLYFPGNGATWVEVPSTPDLNLGYGSLYLEAFVAPVQCGAGAYYPILDKWGGSNGYTFYLEGTGLGQVRAALRLGGSIFTSTQSFTANFTPPSGGIWTQVAVKVDGASGVFYVNGNPAGTFAAPGGSTINTLPLWIGALHTPPGGMGHCEIGLDEVKIGTINPIYSGQ
ncbi:LamG-like jellyroll fold domain-containing protein [Meiothermus sp. QL-1]|uniref:LamG-like jellyroll fold domain-containing protein n=1 Tax=Meiothermus sp. QL-1 TaxID=2058095 RepID=UPI0018F161CE|nr:LamG-like jellyroll fold domain-containing protein [Meiothermus sp. QL-1]